MTPNQLTRFACERFLIESKRIDGESVYYFAPRAVQDILWDRACESVSPNFKGALQSNARWQAMERATMHYAMDFNMMFSFNGKHWKKFNGRHWNRVTSGKIKSILDEKY